MALFSATPATQRNSTAARSARRLRGIVALVVLFAALTAFAASRGTAASERALAAEAAAPAAEPGGPEGAAAPSSFLDRDPFEGLFGRTMVGLALFAIALAIVLVVVRRRFGSRPFQSGRRLALLETLPLGGRRFVCLLSLDRERLLVVGVSGENFSLLSETRAESEKASLGGATGAPPTGSAAPPGRSFDAALEKARVSS